MRVPTRAEVLVDEYGDAWLNAGFSPTTLKTYVYLLTKRLPEGFIEAPTYEVASGWLTSVRLANPKIKRSTMQVYTRAVKDYAVWWADRETRHDCPTPDPLAALEHVKAQEAPPGRIAEDGEIAKMLKLVAGKDFTARRAHCIITFLRDTGARRSEIARIRLTNIDFERDRLRLPLTKNGRGRNIKLSADMHRSLGRYLVERADQPHHDCDELWIGQRGPLTVGSVGQIVDRIADKAEVKVRCHQLRRRFALQWVKDGGTDDALAHVGGWRSMAMVARYRAAAIEEIAEEQYERIVNKPKPPTSFIRNGKRYIARSP